MTTTEVHTLDAMQFVNDQDATTIERFIDRLEFRGGDPTFVGYRDAYLDLLDLAGATTVLDVGCGTGVVARSIAARDDFDGTVVGIDQSPAFIAAAIRLSANDRAPTASNCSSAMHTNWTFPPGVSTSQSPTRSSATSATR